MTGKKFRVLSAEGAPGEAADSVRALYPGPDRTRELSIVSTLPTLGATIKLAAPEAIFLDLSLGKPDPLEAVRRVASRRSGYSARRFCRRRRLELRLSERMLWNPNCGSPGAVPNQATATKRGQGSPSKFL
jgi:hypothetical protein